MTKRGSLSCRLIAPRVRGTLVASALALAVLAAPLALAQVGAGATLVVLSGAVAVQQASGATVSPARTGLTLGVGDQVSTSANAGALISFFDGSEVELAPETSLQIRELASAGAQSRIGLAAIAGASIHTVVALTDPGSSYRVEAGSTVLLVRGTIFGHRASPNGDVIVALERCGTTTQPVANDCVDFPAPGQRVRVGEKVTAQPSGQIIREQFTPGAPLFNIIQANQGGGLSSASFPSPDACVQQQMAQGEPFASALATCSQAFAPPPPPSAPPPPPGPATASVEPTTVTDAPVIASASTGPIMSDPTDVEEDDNENENENDNDDRKKKDDKKPKKPPPPKHPGCSC